MDNELDLQYDRLLGEGSYGKVFLVKQQDGQQFAVKEIDLTKCDEGGREQAHGESNLLSRLKQDNILLYVESVICDECLYIVTEYCEGGDLEDYLQTITKKKESIPEALVSDWILQLGGALKYLHDQKILHRDMKTKNIFLKDDLTVKLGDLGIAKVLDLNQSKADTFIGTPSYMSPELFSGQSYNHKTDIWGLGCCAYEMMTLKRAFQGKALWTLIREIKNGRVLELPDTFSLDIRTLVQEMMSQKPEDRPSARDIVQDDLLLYHRGAAQELVQSLPRPHEHVQEKQKSKSSRNKSGSGSGSLRNVLLQMSQSQDEKYRDSIAQVCEKINTLRMTGKSVHDDNDDGGEYDTFVYKGDSDEELEAKGTILDNSLLKQYTEQLDTFVFKGEGILGSNSDNATIKSPAVKTRGTSNDEADHDNVESEDEECANRTLLKQYSETLEEDDEADDDAEVRYSFKDDVGNRSNVHVIEENDDSSPAEDGFDETLVNVSKYQYKGLKDTFALRRDKGWKRHPSDSRDLFLPVDEGDSASKPVRRSDSDSGVKSPPKSKSLSLSASFSGASSISGSGHKVTDPRLNQSLRSDDGLHKTKNKMRTCDRIEQSAKIKQSVERKARPAANRTKSPKKTAFVEIDPKADGLGDDVVPDLNVKDVMSHLRENITPYTSVDSHSEVISPAVEPDDAHARDNSPNKVKKKSSYLKKQSEAKRKAPDIPTQSPIVGNGTTDKNVKLFTRAQSAKFSKADQEDGDSDIHTEQNGKPSIQDVLRNIQRDCSETMRNEQILAVQHELAEGVGYRNFKKVVDILCMISDEHEVNMHIVNILGPKLYETYKHHITVCRLLEDGSRSTSS